MGQQDRITNAVVEFYGRIFEQIFFLPFDAQIRDGLKRREVRRRVEEAADAASRSLSRFLTSQNLPEDQACEVLCGLDHIAEVVALEDIANPRVTPEGLVERLGVQLPCPERLVAAERAPVYRLALHAVAQVLLLVGPLMAEWSKLTFATTFELPRRVVDRLNRISDQLEAFSVAQKDALDERYELEYRDYLLQRFHRIEAGTVRMTSNLSVDLGELFVAPRLRVRSLSKQQTAEAAGDDLASLAVERQGLGLGVRRPAGPPGKEEDDAVAALDHVKEAGRSVLVGRPGSGKSTFLEWLQLALAGADEHLVLAGKQAIPLLLRVRELDPQHLPTGADLVLKATGSPDRVTIMPAGWIERRLDEGRVLLMLDGLDETNPGVRDAKVLPWLRDLCQRYRDCRFLISSRPVGYPPGELGALGFVECDLLDFTDAQVAEYTRHWCTAVRQAQNEPTSEAREQGAKDGEAIVRGFSDNPYIRDLARNALMLSAICLVNYFEGGSLPTDRAMLYRLCVEGLLHHWDKRRGIHSEFTLEEKLRACREVAIGMQAVDRAEWRAADVRAVFTTSLADEVRAEQLLEHVRYRTGLLVERRPWRLRVRSPDLPGVSRRPGRPRGQPPSCRCPEARQGARRRTLAGGHGVVLRCCPSAARSGPADAIGRPARLGLSGDGAGRGVRSSRSHGPPGRRLPSDTRAAHRARARCIRRAWNRDEWPGVLPRRGRSRRGQRIRRHCGHSSRERSASVAGPSS